MVLDNSLNTYVPLRAQFENNSNGKVKIVVSRFTS